MHFTKKSTAEKRKDFVNNLKENKLLRFPGAYNPLCAKLIAEIGFDGVYISGAVMSNDLGIPDIGLTTLEHVSYRANQIAKATDVLIFFTISSVAMSSLLSKCPHLFSSIWSSI